jgi:hypothetical protein
LKDEGIAKVMVLQYKGGKDKELEKERRKEK